ncbi:hypothetical protein BaRGS_00038370, partial [Batillaria attramentaria]
MAHGRDAETEDVGGQAENPVQLHQLVAWHLCVLSDILPTLVLVWHNSSRSYKWRGDWHYSVYQYPAGAYPFICERRLKVSSMIQVLLVGANRPSSEVAGFK